MLARGLAAHHGEVTHQPVERRRHLGEITALGGPVVHRQVDVDRVLRVPRRIGTVVPDALQVGGLGARTRTGHEQVAAELVIERGKIGIGCRRKPRDPFVGGHGEHVGRRPLEGQLHAPEPLLVLHHVVVQQGAVVACPGALEHGAHPLGRIAAHVVIIDKVGGRSEDDGDRVGIGHAQGAILHADRAAAARGAGGELRLIGELPRDAEIVGILAGDAQAVGANAVHLEIIGAVVGVRQIAGTAQLCREVERASAARGQVDHDHLVGGADEHIAREGHAINDVGYSGDGRVEVEAAAIPRGALVPGKGDQQVAQRLVLHLFVGDTHHRAAEEVVRPGHVAGEEEAADLGEGGAGALAHRIVRPAGPERLFVELDLFLGAAAEDHGADPAVADRQGAIPFGGRIAVPERCGWILLRGEAVSEQDQGEQYGGASAMAHRLAPEEEGLPTYCQRRPAGAPDGGSPYHPVRRTAYSAVTVATSWNGGFPWVPCRTFSPARAVRYTRSAWPTWCSTQHD